MKRKLRVPMLYLMIGLLYPVTACHSQDIHPQKTHYQDAPVWPANKPGDVTLKNFKPFRAVYQRTYTNGAGQQRTDRVIISAEEIGWYGDPAIAITLIDTGAPEFDDTNGRSLFMYVKKEDLSVLFEVGPKPGTAVDYYVGRSLPGKMLLSTVTTDTGGHDFQEMPADAPGFGPGSWVMASMDLDEGMKIRLDPTYSPRANALTGFANIGYVAGKETYTDLSGATYEAWMVEHTTNLASPVLARRPMINRPPYVLGTQIVNLDTGDQRNSMQLISFEYLGEE